jgi:hypothetical protein
MRSIGWQQSITDSIASIALRSDRVLGSAGCQPALFGSLPKSRSEGAVCFAIRVAGKLPAGAGKLPALPREELSSLDFDYIMAMR